jgi:hypothetical protein
MLEILFGFASVVFLSIVVWIGIRRQAKFREKFPPISDAEFMALCPPGTRPEIALRVRKIISDSLNVEYERIYPSSRLNQDLGAD